MNPNLVSSKFILAVLIIAGLFALTVMKILDVEKFMVTVLGIYGTYSATNVVSKFAP